MTNARTPRHSAGGTNDSPLGDCPECYADKLELRKAQASLKAHLKPQLKFASVDCTAHAELCERFGVTSGTAAERAGVEDPEEPVVPHIAWFRDGDNQGVYDGPAGHSSTSIVAWAEDKHSKGLLRLASSG